MCQLLHGMIVYGLDETHFWSAERKRSPIVGITGSWMESLGARPLFGGVLKLSCDGINRYIL